VPSGETTWHGLAILIIECAIKSGASLKVKSGKIQPILAAEYPLPAPRPMNSRMATRTLARALVASGNMAASQLLQQSWEPLVAGYVQDLAHKKII